MKAPAAYAHGAGTDDPLMRLTGNSGGTDATTQSYLADGLGSIVGAAGDIVPGAVITVSV